MTDQMTRVVPAGWYDDPKSAEHVRWWNGLGWTDHVEIKPTAPAAEQAPVVAAEPEPAPAAPVAPAAPAAKPTIGLGFGGGGGYYAQKYGRDDD